MPSIQFIPVKTNQEKLTAICRIVGQHFYKGDAVLVKVDTTEAAGYINELLWKMPPESFIPHVQSEEATGERVVITCGIKNVNQATVLINLGTGIHPDVQRFDMVYELFDMTHPSKAQASQERRASYERDGHKPGS